MEDRKILIIQTAFLGDVILSTSLIESISLAGKTKKIDFLLRKGNESVLEANPNINKIWIWDKKQSKYKNLIRLLKEIRAERYDLVINVNRFGASGFLTAFSNAKTSIGFKKNPFSFLFNLKVAHEFNKHEIERNFELLKAYNKEIKLVKPKLYPAKENVNKVGQYIKSEYVTIAPASVWFTKQLPVIKWVELISNIPQGIIIYLIGAKADEKLADEIINQSEKKLEIINLCGQLKVLDTAELMKHAKMNYMNDSGPLHIASAMNAPSRAVFCSTVKEFGFGPLSDDGQIIEIKEKLDCRPCGLHGKKECPEGHFNCAYKIELDQKSIGF